MFNKGNEYNFKYPDVLIDTGIDGVKKYSVDLVVMIPSDYNYLYGTDPYLIRYVINNDYDNNHLFIKYYDKPKLRGKKKWIFRHSKNISLKISDLPASVDCSLNTFEPPKKRNWFKHKSFGFTNDSYEKISLVEAMKYPLMIEYNDIIFLYRIACDIVKIENPLDMNFHSLKERVGNCFLLNYPFKMQLDLLENYHLNYLRDIMKIW